MNHHKFSRRILAMALSVVMVLGMLPVTAAAEELPAGTSGEITAFEKLADATATQTVALGTPFEDLDLPETLTVTVRLATAPSEPVQDSDEPRQEEGKQEPENSVQDSDNPKQEEPEQNDNNGQNTSAPAGDVSAENQENPAGDVQASDQEETDTGYTEMTVPVPVTWTASPGYDGDTAGEYVFTAEVSGFTVSAEPPVITVTVCKAAVNGIITAFDELPEDIRWQNTNTPVFPETLTKTIEGQNAQIPVTWEADHDYDSDSSATGLYVFTAKPVDGYALAEGVELPRITVYIPAVNRMMRMAGNATSASPLEITTAAQLSEIAVLVNSGKLETFLFNDSTATVSLKLMNDLDLSAYGEGWNSGKGWVPIGTTSTNSFKGTFDGDNKKITGLFINRTEQISGLFGCIDDGTVQNLRLEDVSITGSDQVGSVAGLVIGNLLSMSSLNNCFVTGAVNGEFNVGGVAGNVGGSVENCGAAGTVSGTASVGGVAGDVGGSVTNSYATSAVSGTSNVGGVVGAVRGSVTNSYAIGAVSGSICVGGVAGAVRGSVTNSYATGAVNGNDDVGGVAGWVSGSVKNCAALNPSVSGSSNVGRVVGIVGGILYNMAFSGMTDPGLGKFGSIANSLTDKNGADVSHMNIILSDFWMTSLGWTVIDWTIMPNQLPILTGIPADMQDASLPPHLVPGSSSPHFLGAGTNEDPYQISTAEQLAKLAELVNAGDTSYNSKYYKLTANLDLSVYGKNWNNGKGWIPIGTTNTKPFKGTFDGNNQTITGLFIDRTEQYTGLFGYVDGGTVQKLGLEKVSIRGENNVGGVAGYVDTGCKVANCYATGVVSGRSDVGGVVGYVNFNGYVTNCYATGAVSGTYYIGGVAGYVNFNGYVTNCYATGAVSGTYYIGGVAGYVVGGSDVTNCAALNPSVKGNSDIGRVVGYIAITGGGSPLSNNMAFSGMTDPSAGKFGTIANDPNDKNGADVSHMDIFSSLFWIMKLGWTSIDWTIMPNRLPILTGIPSDMQDDSLPPHLVLGSSSPHFLGAGTNEDPYQISTAEQLAKLAELVNADDTSYNSKYYKLTANLDLSVYGKNWNSGKGWVPIGTDTNSFMGTFDGNGKKITGLFINRTEQYTGLFGCIDGGAVQNLGLEKVSITGGNCVGGVAGYFALGGSVTNCYVTVMVSITGGDSVGGVAGYLDGRVADCYVTGTVSGGSNIGGVAGFTNGSVTNCYATGAVSGTGDHVGGVAGYLGGSVTNCAALNPLVSGSGNVGRVVGDAGASLTNNVAFSGMTDPGTGKFGTIANDPTDKNGANITSEQITKASFWTATGNWDTSGWDTSVWTFTDGKLPILKNAGGMQSGDGGLYLIQRDISSAAVTLNDNTYTYTGSPILPTLTVTFDGATLVKDQDYTVTVTSTDGTGTSAGTNVGTVTLEMKGIGNFKGTKTGVTFQIVKADGPAAPLVTGAYTGNGSTFTYTVNAIPGAEYSTDNITWQDSNVFVGFTTASPATTFYARIKETGTHKTGAVGNTAAVTFTKLENTQAPELAYTVSGTNNSRTITITAVSGTEYKFGDDVWGSSNSKGGYTSAQTVTIQIRYMQTATHNSSFVNSVSVNLAKQNQTAPPAFELGYAYNANINQFTVTIPERVNAEYSFDGIVYSQTRTKTAAPGDSVTSYMRYMETDANNQSSATAVLLTLPLPVTTITGSGTTTTITAPEKQPNQPVTAAAPVTATAGANGTANANIPDKTITDAIAKAQSDAKSQGKSTNGISVELNVSMPNGATSLTANLTRSSLNSLVSAGVSSLTINGSLVTVSFDKKALAEIQKQSTGNISIAIAPKSNLSKAAKKIIGTRPIYDITVGYGSGKTVSSFGGGIATVSISYSLGKNEAVGGVYAVYVDEKGNAARIAGSVYDANSGRVIFTTIHFSQYGIGYTAPSAKFTDISSHWAKESIDYVVGRGLLSGTSETAFSPNSAMTRGMLVTALGRLAGVDTKAYTGGSFTDVNADSAYRPYIEWVYSKGMIQGIGNSQFAPDRAVTREEIAVIFANYAKATIYTLPITREATTYADAVNIGSDYKDAVKAMQQAGIMMGGSDNKFNPKGNATRAEVSSMLGRYIKLTINPDTAQGWAQNDAGQYLYYKDGKALTGTQTIDGVKYFLGIDGILKTGWVKDGDNWRFYSGKTMLVGFWDLDANGNNKTYYFTKDGLMVSGKWLEIDGKWYYFYTDGSLARSTKIDGYEVDENGVRKIK